MECLCAMALSSFLKCWLCDNVDIVLLWISSVGNKKAMLDDILKEKYCIK